MPYQKFEDLSVWQAATDLAVEVFAMTEAGCLKGHPGLRDQLERASISVSNNIAEGYERGTHEELLTFLYYARGSAGEVRSMLRFLERGVGWEDRRQEISRLIPLALSISRQLGAWIESLKNSESKGPRYQNDRTRQAGQATRRSEAFLDELRRIQAENARGPDQPPGDARSAE